MIVRPWLFCSAILSTCALARADFLDWLFPKSFEVVTNTDVTDPAAPSPSANHPVFYIAVSAGYRDLGHAVAGEKVPPSGDIVKLVTKILDRQGYKLATNKNLPTIMIVYTWGTLHPDRPYPDAPYAVTNRGQMLNFLGAAKVGIDTRPQAEAFSSLNVGLTPLSSDASALEEMTNDGLYVVSLSAYDFASAQSGNAKLLWRTNISTPSSGHYLPEVLPSMLTIAGPHIGRETNRPIRVDVGNNFRPNVEIGPATVIEEDVKTGERK